MLSVLHARDLKIKFFWFIIFGDSVRGGASRGHSLPTGVLGLKLTSGLACQQQPLALAEPFEIILAAIFLAFVQMCFECSAS